MSVAAAAACLTATLLPNGGAQAQTTPGSTVTTNPSTWRTWHLTSNDQFRLAAPPAADSKKTRRELRELRSLQEERTQAIKRQVEKWNGQPATIPWTNVLLDNIKVHALRPPPGSRALRYLHTAMYDAMVAAYDSKVAYASETRPKPAKLDPRIDPLVGGKKGSSYGNVQAAVAGAAEVVLTYVFPDESPSTFSNLATKAIESRLYAGANYRSDVERARALGNAVGALVVEEAKTDGIANPGTSSAFPRPTAGEERAYASNNGIAEQQWQPAPPNHEGPFLPVVSTWRPQLMDGAGGLRHVLTGPLVYGSPEFIAETKEVLDISRTLTEDQEAIAHFWDDPPVATTTPPGHWFEIAMSQLDQYPMTTPETARAFALLGATMGDAAIASWDAKYYWWSIRPIQAIWRLCENDTVLYTDAAAQAADEETCPYYDNSNLSTSNPNYLAEDDGWYPIIDTPGFPSYVGGHSTFSGSAGKLLSYLFPASTGTLNQQAEEAAMSRLYGGIHFRDDNDDGLTLGRALADLAIEWAETDGSN